MAFPTQAKKIIIGVIILAVVFTAYTVFFRSSAPTDEALLAAVGDSQTAGRDFLLLLSELKSIKLDFSIFDDPVFKGLSDFGSTLSPQPIGKKNPFAPLPTAANRR